MSTSANVGIKAHNAYDVYPKKVYDYANEWFEIYKNVNRPSLVSLQKSIQFFKGYRVPIGTLSHWHFNYRKYGDVRRDYTKRIITT